MSIERIIKAVISRALPQAGLDTTEQPLRIGRYQDLYTVGAVRKQHVLADEGSYFVANNGGTGVATAVANCGGVEGFIGTAGALGGAGLPPIIIGPGQCVLINFLILTQSAASSWTPELGIWER